MNWTAEKLLALSKDELDVEAAKVLVPQPWKHRWDDCVCLNCGKPDSSGVDNIQGSSFDDVCPVPRPTDTDDWNVAMGWRDWITRMIVTSVVEEIFSAISKVENRCFVYGPELTKWWFWNARPRHYIIAAILAGGPDGN